MIGNQLEPSSGSDYDQQGWWVYEHEIEIVNIVVTHPNDSEVFEIGSIVAPKRIITFYALCQRCYNLRHIQLLNELEIKII